VDGIFVLGTTGEAPSLPDAIRVRLASASAEHVGNQTWIYAGISDNCLSRSIEAADVYFSAALYQSACRKDWEAAAAARPGWRGVPEEPFFRAIAGGAEIFDERERLMRPDHATAISGGTQRRS
jgi:hypothetical protein